MENFYVQGIIAIVIVQLLENNFYQPLIMGHAMKLHPVTIMLGLLIFGHFFGIIGMILKKSSFSCYHLQINQYICQLVMWNVQMLHWRLR